MSLSKPQRSFLTTLVQYGGGPLSSTDIAQVLYGDGSRAGNSEQVGMRLHAAGFVTGQWNGSCTIWTITDAGRAAL